MLEKIKKILTQATFVFLLALPASNNYEMHDYSFGGGGTGLTSSSNYKAKGVLGETSGALDGTTYDMGAGLEFMQQANVPGALTFTNPANHYNKLKFVLNTGDNPSDAQFAIAISTDNFVTTNYIQADNTIGATAVYQTYTTWGGASGAFVIGLATNTTYKVKAKAIHTLYNETQFGPESSASTSSVNLTYDLDVASTDTESAPPYIVSFGTLSVGSVTTAADKIWVDLDTNADNGAFVYLYSNSSGLQSANASYTITSATADLTGVSEGYGIQIATVTQSSGGPLAKVSPYNGAMENVGIINTTSRNILTTSNAPIVGGRASIFVKAKASTSTPAASDFSSTITMIASSTF